MALSKFEPLTYLSVFEALVMVPPIFLTVVIVISAPVTEAAPAVPKVIVVTSVSSTFALPPKELLLHLAWSVYEPEP